MSDNAGWIGFDLDGTLAVYDGWRGKAHIGEPIPATIALVRGFLKDGLDVRIFTARCSEPDAVPFVEAWCEKHIGQVLPITNVKDYGCWAIFDDRAIAVQKNTGQIVAWPDFLETLGQ